ncbi:MAG: hypothetical protein NTU41_05175 [Chloroflexi bacterium]|nr:hypothetical protein [Chloroflexota bacterium]
MPKSEDILFERVCHKGAEAYTNHPPSFGGPTEHEIARSTVLRRQYDDTDVTARYERAELSLG